MTPSRTRALALVLMLLGSVIALLASTQVWVVGRLAADGQPAITLEATGRTLAPLGPSVAILGLGAVAALFLVRALGRRIIAVLVVLACIVAIVSAVGVARAPVDAISGPLADASGLQQVTGVDATAVSVEGSAWPWIATAGLVLLALGATIAFAARQWGGSTARFQSEQDLPQSAAPKAHGPKDSGISAWDALDRGIDPTADGDGDGDGAPAPGSGAS